MIVFFGLDCEYSFLSNFYRCKFIVDGVEYHSSEQFYMMLKAKHFGDVYAMNQIKECTSAAKAKSWGRKVRNFDSNEWDRSCESAMQWALTEKFTQNAQLKNMLLDTGDELLVEASPFDGIWGVKLKANDPRIKDPKNWKGRNLLGQCLMQVRNKLRESTR